MKLFSVIALIFCSQAQAGVFVEPYLGYDSATTTATTTSGGKASSTSSGFDYGARLGYRFANDFWLAGEYTGGSGKDESDSGGSDYNKAAMGATVGYAFTRQNNKWNVWAGYGFSDELTRQTSPELTVTGTNFRLGVGWEATNHVNLNLDVTIATYTKAKMGGNEVELSTLYSKFSTSTVMLAVAFPFGTGK